MHTGSVRSNWTKLNSYFSQKNAYIDFQSSFNPCKCGTTKIQKKWNKFLSKPDFLVKNCRFLLLLYTVCRDFNIFLTALHNRNII